MHPIRFLPLLAGLTMALVPPVSPASTPADQGLGGKPVPGVCMLSREAIYANAKIGQAATARLKQLAGQQRAAIEAERKPLDADIQAFRTQTGLKAGARQDRGQALARRMQAVRADEALRGRELEATRAKAMERIAQAAQPVIAKAYAARGCGLLVNRDMVLGGNTANDLTAAVVQGLDAKITTLTFDLEKLPAGSGKPASP